MDEHRLPALEVSRGEQTLLGSAERDRDARSPRRVQSIGDLPGGHGGNGALGGVRAGCVQGHNPVALSSVLDTGANCDDCSRGEVPDDVRDRRRRRPGAS